LTVAPEVLRPLADYRQVFYGVLLLVLVVHGRRLRVPQFRRGNRAPGTKRGEAKSAEVKSNVEF
jgi:hypothetical protein